MGGRMRVGMAGVAVLAVLAVSGVAEEPSTVGGEYSGARKLNCDFGGDIRTRAVHLDNIPVHVDIPIPGVSEDGVLRGETEFYRFRTRVWGAACWDQDFNLRMRVLNEFRHQEKSRLANAWEWPDELIVDQLYFDLNHLAGGNLDLRIGRQDLIYGTGKLILDGTPLDGSRTIYLDAAKATWKGMEGYTVDVVGIYQSGENDLAVGNEHRNLTGASPSDEPYDEYGGVIYVKGRVAENLKGELYHIYKVEEEYVRGSGLAVEESEILTFGARLMPAFCAAVNGSFEGAFQAGSQGDVDREAYMFDGMVNWTLPCDVTKPILSAGYYYLSGDDAATSDNERWNPLWARWPQYSELYVYAFDTEGAGWWSNVSMPHVDLSFIPWKDAKTTLLVGHMSAPEANGPGGGKTRGMLATFKTDFTIAKGLIGAGDRLYGHVLFEYFDPDSYYRLATDAAHFARLELSYEF